MKLKSWEQCPHPYPDGTGMITNGNGWQHPFRALAKTEDGVVRSVRLNQQADNYFSWPGRASVKGKTVRGFVTAREGGLEFCVYKGHKEILI